MLCTDCSKSGGSEVILIISLNCFSPTKHICSTLLSNSLIKSVGDEMIRCSDKCVFNHGGHHGNVSVRNTPQICTLHIVKRVVSGG